ncbi:pseudouridine synthase [Erysipelothrix urinaevulpis]|uniref:pseudouridine synthase n=1 Tax=Erysipelothrix urinaevulpis TaxID=2683717 RepID=UPI0013568532|nr:pseudouridine synthase [Erysipelothrix urinaevulpis]
MRLDKFLAHNNFGSRKEVKEIVKQKRVFINDELVKNSAKIIDLDKDVVFVDGQEIKYKKDIYYMMNKPKDTISSHDDSLYPSVLSLIDDYRDDLIMVGRLDADTEGLLLITNDGQFSHKIAHGKKDVKKVYYVELESPFDQKYIKELEQGIVLDDGPIKPAFVEVLTDTSLHLTISEGKYHQVKRMMHYCENEVLYLKRIQIGPLRLDSQLDTGQYRSLTQEEIDLF